MCLIQFNRDMQASFKRKKKSISVSHFLHSCSLLIMKSHDRHVMCKLFHFDGISHTFCYNKYWVVHFVFKWLLVKISIKLCISVPEDRFYLSKQCRPRWNAALCDISSASSLFAKVPVYYPEWKGLTVTIDWLQSLNQFFVNVSYHILVVSLTLMALKTEPSELDWLQVYDMTHWWKIILRTGASLLLPLRHIHSQILILFPVQRVWCCEIGWGARSL